MMINKNNYELYAIDYLENNLDKETNAEMIRFLNNHIEIKEALDLLKSPVIMITDTSIKFESKSLLKKEEKQKKIWIPIFIKYAAAIALLISIGSVWYLSNQNNTIDNVVATSDTLNNNSETISEMNTDSKKENTTAVELNKPNPLKVPSQAKIDLPAKPNQINIPEKYMSPSNTEVNKANSSIIIPEPIDVATNENNWSSGNKIESTSNNLNTNYKRVELSISSIDLLSHTDPELSNGSIRDEITLSPLPTVTIYRNSNKPKGSWILNALTKKSDGTKIFAFEGVKRALTPTRLRDVNVDKASTDSPFKQFTHD